MVLHGCRIIQSPEIESLSTFNIPEVLDGKPQSILQGQTENFDDYYPCIQKECTLFHI